MNELYKKYTVYGKVDEKPTQISDKHRFVKNFIEQLSSDEQLIINVQKGGIQYPSELQNLLQEMGWERSGFEWIGWLQKSWYHYTHSNYDFELIIKFDNITGGLVLYRKNLGRNI